MPGPPEAEVLPHHRRAEVAEVRGDDASADPVAQRRRGVGELSGVFNLRTPRRPNPIGLSILKLERVEGNRLFVNNVDMLDATPILDLKPYAGIERDDEHASTQAFKP